MRYRRAVRLPPHWLRVLSGWVLAGLGVGGLMASCTLTLDDEIACGDGYVDEPREQCDPGVSESFVDACRGTARPDGIGGCDPETCQWVTTIAQCARCGDDEVDPEVGEECDGSNLGIARCPGGVGLPVCTDTCTLDYASCRTCGNGMPDPGEECDSPQGGLVGPPRPCTDLIGLTGTPYTSGAYNFCNDKCLYSRVGCGYCGNGKIEDAKLLDLDNNFSPPEACDVGDFIEADIRDKYGGTACYDNEDQRPFVVCNDDCTDFELSEPATCCLKSMADCPNNESPVRCCYELEHPNEAEACLPNIDAGNWAQVCK